MEVDGKRLDLCEPCQEEKVLTKTDGKCIDCDQYMCQACFQSHLKLKICRNHVFASLGGVESQAPQNLTDKCKIHTTEVIKYYCRNHDSVGCGDCLVAFHQQCEIKFIRDICKNIEDGPDFKNILKEIDNLEELKAKIERSLVGYRNENTEFHDRAIQGIQKSRTAINDWLNNVTSQIEADEMEVWKENEIVVSKLENWIQIIGDMINKVRDETNTDQYSGENLFIRVVEVKSELSEFTTKYVPEIKSSLEIKYFAFEPNQSLVVFTKSAKLGVIRFGGGKREDFPEPEAPNACKGESPEDVDADLKKELEKFRQMAVSEKEKNERLQKSYDKLKTECEDQASLNYRRNEGRTQSTPMTKEREQEIFDLKQRITILNDLNTNLEGSLIKKSVELKASQKALEGLEKEVLESESKDRQSLQAELKKINEKNDDLDAQLESVKKEYSLYKYQSQARQEQDKSKILSLQSELKKISEKHDSIEAKHDSLKKDYEIYKAQAKARQEQDQSKFISLQSELRNISENNNDLKVQLENRKKEYEKLKTQSEARQEEDRSKILILQSELKRISKSNGSEAKFESLKKEYETHKAQCKASQEQDQSKILSLQSELKTSSENNVNLEAQVNNLKNKYELLESQYRARQEQDQKKILSFLSEQKKFSENNDFLKAQHDNLKMEYETYKTQSESREEQYRSEIRSLKSELDLQIEINDDLMAQLDSLKQRLQEQERQNPRAAGFDVGARVKDNDGLDWIGTVTAVDPSGYVDVEWDNGSKSRRLSAGVNGKYDVKQNF